ncbi:MAG: ABC transporter ATP-binding protein [Desulfobacterales bacterium]
MGLKLDRITKRVGDENHLQEISLELTPGSRNVVLGRTLAGKTSLLRILAGLDRPTSGTLWLDDKNITGTFVRKRNVAMVYQQFINYPSLTVYRNIASPLKMKGLSKAEIDRRVRETAAILHLETMLDRRPAELSGGQQQRTAIARALVKEADLLLLDEPLVNLDYKLREELREELRQIFQQRQAIVVYTTTEPAEALMLGGNIIVMDEGRILQHGQTPEVYHNPLSTKVAEVFSDPPINFLDGQVQQKAARLGENVQMALKGHLQGVDDGRYRFGVRANRLSSTRRPELDVEIKGKVTLCEINGSETFIHVQHAENRLVAQENGIRTRPIGSEITLYADSGSFFVYDPDGRLVASPANASALGQPAQ